MTANSVKWTIISIATTALCGWLVHLSLRHASLTHEHGTMSELRAAQIRTISTWNELTQKVGAARRRRDKESWSMKYALSSFRNKEINSDLFESFAMPFDNYALYSSSETGSGYFLLPDEESEVVAYVRTLTSEESGERLVEHLKQTLESPDSRIILPAKPNHLTEYQFETSGSAGALEFGCRVTDTGESRFVPICDVKERYEGYGSDGPYHDGIFKNHEYEVTYGWPPLSDLSLLNTLQERGIWLIACNEDYRSVNRPFEQSLPLHVVLVLETKREWRIHPDYLYCRSLNAGFDLEWDPQQEDYLATPKYPGTFGSSQPAPNSSANAKKESLESTREK